MYAWYHFDREVGTVVGTNAKHHSLRALTELLGGDDTPTRPLQTCVGPYREHASPNPSLVPAAPRIVVRCAVHDRPRYAPDASDEE